MEGNGDAARIQVNFYEVGTKWLVAAMPTTKNMSIEIIDKGLIDYQESHQEMLDLVKSHHVRAKMASRTFSSLHHWH